MANPPANQDMAQILKEHELNKKTTQIPLFLGTDKDTSSGRDIIEKIELAAGIANWNDARKIAELKGCVRDHAKKRLDCILRMCPKDMTVWNNVKAEFLKQYDPKGTAKTTCAGFTDLAQKHGEKVGDFMGRVDEHFRRIMDNRSDRLLRPIDTDNIPAAQVELVSAVLNRGTREMLEAVEQIVFTAGLNETLRQKVMEAGKPTLYEAFDFASEMEIYLADKKAKANAVQINSVHEAENDPDNTDEPEFENEEEFNAVNAFRVRRGLPPRPRPQRFRNSGYRSNGSNNGSQNKKDFRCRYCKKMGHNQTECRKRIREGGQCVDEAGKPWKNQPKVNEAKDSVRTAPLNSFRNL